MQHLACTGADERKFGWMGMGGYILWVVDEGGGSKSMYVLPYVRSQLASRRMDVSCWLLVATVAIGVGVC